MKTTLIKIVFLLFYFLLPDCTVAQPKDSNLSNEITIENLVIEGSTITSKINSILSPYLNQRIPLREVSTIQRAINQFYQNQGYLSSYAIIPLQNFEDGIVKIQVIESRISEIKVKSNSHLSDNYIKAFSPKTIPLGFIRNKLAPPDVFNNPSIREISLPVIRVKIFSISKAFSKIASIPSLIENSSKL